MSSSIKLAGVILVAFFWWQVMYTLETGLPHNSTVVWVCYVITVGYMTLLALNGDAK